MDRACDQNPVVAEPLLTHLIDDLMAQPKEQLGGVKTTIANYLKYFTDPDIMEVFCPEKSTFQFR